MRVAVAAIAASLLFASSSIVACDESGNRIQRVFATSGGVYLKDWVVSSSEAEAVEMPNGFKVGVSIEPAAASKYASLREEFSPELVRISLFDLTPGEAPRELTHTWGGANSIQGYGSRGGADRVAQLGEPGITLTLINAVCVNTRAIAQAE